MKILVAGGAGYIGSVLAPLLHEHGCQVDVIDLMWFGNHLPRGISATKRDLFSLDATDLAGYDQVIFLAGLSNDPMAEYDPVMNFVQNGALPPYLAFCAQKAGVKRFIYASSCSIYGYTENRLYDEDAPVFCSYPYGISKTVGERGVLQQEQEGFSTIALRQGTVNGHSPRMRFDLIVNTMFKSAMTDGRIVVNNPAIWRPIIDVRDTAKAFVCAVRAEPELSGVYNIAYDNFTVGQVAEEVKKAVEKHTGKAIDIETRNTPDFRNYKVDCAKANTQLHFRPDCAIADIVDSLFAHYADYGDLTKEDYYNIEVFKKIKKQQTENALGAH
ncbi:MAG TPA: SDR family oxidoreductase [Candidatus Hydrogenedentes bacterium]|nr:SDR family oxidoreductase [Candidatus Hydrogenedentota bacterium]